MPDPNSATYSATAQGVAAGFVTGQNLYLWNTSAANWSGAPTFFPPTFDAKRMTAFVSGAEGKPTPDYPLGATFTGKAWSEPTLLRLAYAFEQASKARRMPPDLPALDGCGH